MKKFFDRGIFIKTLRELFYLNILLVFIGAVLVVLTRETAVHQMMGYAGRSISYNFAGGALIFVAILGGFALSATALSFTWNRKKADFEYALPVTKGALYASKALAVISSLAAVMAIITGLGFALSVKYLGRFVFVSDMLSDLLNSFIFALIIVGAVFLAASVTGKVLSAGILSIGIITIPLLLPVIRYYSMLRIAGFDDSMGQFILIRRSLYLPINLLLSQAPGINFNRYLGGILFSFFLAVAYLAFGYFLFKKRSGDLTGNHTNSKLLHYIIMALIPFAMLNIATISALDYKLEIIFRKTRYIYEMLTYIGASIILMFAYDLLVHRKLRPKNRIIWLFIPLALAAFLLNIGVQDLVLNEQEKDIPTENVKSVNIFSYDEVFSIVFVSNMMPYGYINASEVDITDEEIITELVSLYNERKDEDWGNYMPAFVKFNLKSGRSIYKWVFLDNDYDYPTDTFVGNTFTKIQQLPDYSEKFYDNISPNNVATVSNKEEIVNAKLEAELKEVYTVFDSEYDALPLEEKVMSVDMRGHMPTEWLLNKREVAVVGKLYVRGRVSGLDVVDTYFITFDYTPKAAISYMEAVNMMNFVDAETVIKGIEPGAMGNIRHLSLSFLNTEEPMEDAMVFNRKDDLEAKYFFRAIDALRENGLKEPKADSIILKLQYYDGNVGNYMDIYISVAEDEMNELIDIYNEWQESRE
ncbi:MAG: hypothetical protein JXN65_08250 [Clostridia bacterium]|nr:hypothetical protein [Clostridia bacterium]